MVGASSTGKTYTVRNLVLFGPFRPINNGKLYIFTPVFSKLDCEMWRTLSENIDLCISYNIVKRTTKKPSFIDGSVIIFDDCDQINKIPNWVQQMYSIESHHSNVSVIKISHRRKTGDTIIRSSIQGMFLFNLPRAQMNQTIKEMDMTENEVKICNEILSNNTKLVACDDGTYKNYNKLFIDLRPLNTENGKRPMIYELK